MDAGGTLIRTIAAAASEAGVLHECVIFVKDWLEQRRSSADLANFAQEIPVRRPQACMHACMHGLCWPRLCLEQQHNHLEEETSWGCFWGFWGWV